eukprot:TRINITY_DN49261_c0_g1_i1.p1 TRINITY_DN49261_c0_g1~~TRINITY_DN49261_c0_g1_i1.p1  ORF type:complete len:714 (-),score=136.66 TRINITY_DN49261_c0_g1_i1:421-2562(-)
MTLRAQLPVTKPSSSSLERRLLPAAAAPAAEADPTLLDLDGGGGSADEQQEEQCGNTEVDSDSQGSQLVEILASPSTRAERLSLGSAASGKRRAATEVVLIDDTPKRPRRLSGAPTTISTPTRARKIERKPLKETHLLDPAVSVGDFQDQLVHRPEELLRYDARGALGYSENRCPAGFLPQRKDPGHLAEGTAGLPPPAADSRSQAMCVMGHGPGRHHVDVSDQDLLAVLHAEPFGANGCSRHDEGRSDGAYNLPAAATEAGLDCRRSRSYASDDAQSKKTPKTDASSGVLQPAAVPAAASAAASAAAGLRKLQEPATSDLEQEQEPAIAERHRKDVSAEATSPVCKAEEQGRWTYQTGRLADRLLEDSPPGSQRHAAVQSSFVEKLLDSCSPTPPDVKKSPWGSRSTPARPARYASSPSTTAAMMAPRELVHKAAACRAAIEEAALEQQQPKDHVAEPDCPVQPPAPTTPVKEPVARIRAVSGKRFDNVRACWFVEQVNSENALAGYARLSAEMEEELSKALLVALRRTNCRNGIAGDAYEHNFRLAFLETLGGAEVDISALCCVLLDGALNRRLPAELRGDPRVTLSRLPGPALAGKALEESSVLVAEILKETGPTAFKIGITCNPFNRWLQYEADGYTAFHVVCATEKHGFIEMMEAALIDKFKSHPGCRNIARGGEGGMSGKTSPNFAYLAIAPLTSQPKRAVGRRRKG